MALTYLWWDLKGRGEEREGKFAGCKALKTFEIYSSDVCRNLVWTRLCVFRGCKWTFIIFLKKKKKRQAYGEKKYANTCVQSINIVRSYKYAGCFEILFNLFRNEIVWIEIIWNKLIGR